MDDFSHFYCIPGELPGGLKPDDKEWLEAQVNARTESERPLCQGDYVATLNIDFASMLILECPREETVARLFFILNPKSGEMQKIKVSEVPKEAAHKDYPTGETYWGFPIVYSPTLNRAYICETKEALAGLGIAPPAVAMHNPNIKARRH